jgi:hypothetical protein
MISAPTNVAVDPQGNIYFADYGAQVCRIRKVDVKTGIITTVAGGGPPGPIEEGGPATSAYIVLQDISGDIAVDGSGNIFICSSGLRKVDAASGVITTVAQGLGQKAVVDGVGNVYFLTETVADIAPGIGREAWKIQERIAESGSVIDVAGAGPGGDTGDGGSALETWLSDSVWSIAVDGSGNVYFTDAVRLRMVSAATNIISTIGGGAAAELGFDSDGGPALDAQFVQLAGGPPAIAIDNAGNVYITDNVRVRELIPTSITDANASR